MIIQIDVDGVLRDILTPIDKYYKQDFPEKIKDIKPQIDSQKLIDIYPFDSQDDADKWLREERAFDIFGRGKQLHGNPIGDLNMLYGKIKHKHNMRLVSQQTGRAIPGTLYWLGKYGSLIPNVHMLESQEAKVYGNTKDWWMYSDIIVDDNIDVINKFLEQKLAYDVADFDEDFFAYHLYDGSSIQEPLNEELYGPWYRKVKSVKQFVEDMLIYFEDDIEVLDVELDQLQITNGEEEEQWA